MASISIFKTTSSCFGIAILFMTISSAVADDPPWHLQRIVQRDKLTKDHIDEGVIAFDLATITKQTVNVYIIDSGIRITHNEFANNQAMYGINIENPGSLPIDCDGHGTHVAGLVGGSLNGVANNARLIAVRVLSCQGKGTCSNMLTGLEWVALDHEARSKNGERSAAVMSIGSNNKDCRATIQATQRLWDAGVIIMAAAGNTNSDTCDLYPARNPRTIAVGATDVEDRVFKKNNYGDCIDLFAPGVQVLSAWGEKEDDEWKVVSGSSMAAPLVAGVVSVILGADPTLGSSDVRQIVLSSATRNRILQNEGESVMTDSVNRLLFAPWSRLFDKLEMNQREGNSSKSLKQKQGFPVQHINWNTSSVILSLSLTLKPKTLPAMHYSVIRILSALSSATAIQTSSILPRIAAGVQISNDGKEPESIPLVFYIPVLPSLASTYTDRLIESSSNGQLLNESKEDITFEKGSVREALLVNVSVPPVETGEGLGGDPTEKEEGNTVKIVMIAVGTVIGLALIIAVIVLFIVPRFGAARDHRDAVMEARQNSSVALPTINQSIPQQAQP